MKISRYPLPKSVNQTYICTNEKEEFFLLGHIDVAKCHIPELTGKSGAYAWLEESPDPKIGRESVYNGEFSK
jgi:hypothetical protein